MSRIQEIMAKFSGSSEAASEAPSAPAQPEVKFAAVQDPLSVPGSEMGSDSEAASEAASETAAAEVETASEAAPEPASETLTPAEEPKQDSAAKRFAALSRREKAVREAAQKAEQAARQREEEFKRREAEVEARLRQLEEKEGSLTKVKNPIEALRAHGFTYQEATEAVLGNYKEPEPDPIDAKLTPYQQQLAEMAKEQKELKRLLDEERAVRAKAEQEAQYRAFVDSTRKTIEDNGEKFELLSALGDQGIDIVRETMLEYYHEHKRVPGYAEACEMVEEFLEARYVQPFLGTKKVQAKVAPATSKQPAEKPKASSKPSSAKAVPPALGGSPATVDTSKMSRQERLNHLIKQFS